jgi:hypothetical protein
LYNPRQAVVRDTGRRRLSPEGHSTQDCRHQRISRLDGKPRYAVKICISPEGDLAQGRRHSSPTVASCWLMKDLFGNFFFSYLILATNVAAVVYLITKSWLLPLP